MGEIANGVHTVFFSVVGLLTCTLYEQESGTYIESFTSKMLLPDGQAPPSAEEEESIKLCAEALYAGGADTVSTRSVMFLLYHARPHRCSLLNRRL